jgi:signal transduction histidine kinase
MSYRSFRRVLGETSLERKCRFLFGACLLVLITGSFWWYGSETDRLVSEQNRRNAQALVYAIIAVQHWSKLETNEEFKRFLVDPVAADMKNQEYQWRTINPNATDGRRQPQDELEVELLKRWKYIDQLTEEGGTKSPLYKQRHLPEKHEYQYYQPIYTKSTCVECHRIIESNQDLLEGDLLRIIQVRTPDFESIKAQNQNRALLLTIAIITVFLAMIALYVIVRYVIVKPLSHLREVSDEISRGNMDLRADINTGDEFEELGDAFNRMLRHLGGVQDELRTVNGDLDHKLDELAQANMRLYEMNRLKSDFLATVSHELRTPLNSILGFSDVLGSIDLLDDKQRRYVQNIQRSGRMLLEMINDILDLAKIESGKMEVRPAEFRIEQVISAQCDMARPLTEKKNIDLDYDIEPGLPEVLQDHAKVQQILSNLLSNAIKFTPEGGRIAITAARNRAGKLELVVTDTGVGISEEDQQAIFEKFRQGTAAVPGGDAMTREYSGTGLGLSIVKELCRLLGGEVSLESELGKGSTFTISLPWELREPPRPEQTDDLAAMTRPRLGPLGRDSDSADTIEPVVSAGE